MGLSRVGGVFEGKFPASYHISVPAKAAQSEPAV
jgi:hypothetical protein